MCQKVNSAVSLYIYTLYKCNMENLHGVAGLGRIVAAYLFSVVAAVLVVV